MRDSLWQRFDAFLDRHPLIGFLAVLILMSWVGLLMFGAPYAIMARGWSAAPYVLVISASALAALLRAFSKDARKRERSGDPIATADKNSFRFFVAPLMSLYLGLLVYGAPIALWDLLQLGGEYLYGTDRFNRGLTVVVATMAPLVVGGVLFWMRLRLRLLYGVSEMTAGVLIFVYVLGGTSLYSRVTDPTFLLGALSASIYVVVRGMDNVHVGLRDRDADLTTHAWRFLVRRLTTRRA